MLLFSKYSLSEVNKRKTSNNSSLAGNADLCYSISEESLKLLQVYGLRKPTLRTLLQFLDLVITSPHKTLGKENATGSQDMTLEVWAEPKDLLVQTPCGGGTTQATSGDKEKAGGLTVELAWEKFTDGWSIRDVEKSIAGGSTATALHDRRSQPA